MLIRHQAVPVTGRHVRQARRYPVTVRLEQGTWVARTSAPAFPHVVGAGTSQASATESLVENLAGQLALAEMQGRSVP